MNMLDATDLAQKCEDIVAVFGRVDVVIHCAANFTRGGVDATDIREFRKCLEATFFSAVSVTKSKHRPDRKSP
jgi:NAD(P)-dependent dehydrogenase (short-subunit alcohol dehydrogenase family)